MVGLLAVKRAKPRLKFCTKHRLLVPLSPPRPDCAADFINATEFAENPDTAGLKLERQFFLGGHQIQSGARMTLGLCWFKNTQIQEHKYTNTRIQIHKDNIHKHKYYESGAWMTLPKYDLLFSLIWGSVDTTKIQMLIRLK